VDVLRRLAALLVLGPPLSLLVSAGATWGAAPSATCVAREPHGFDDSSIASSRGLEERTESAVVLVVLDGVRWQEVFGGCTA
jgi:hypothetical protein